MSSELINKMHLIRLNLKGNPDAAKKMSECITAVEELEERCTWLAQQFHKEE